MLSFSRVILAGKRDSRRRHSTTSFSKNVAVAGTSYQMLDVLLFICARSLTSFNKNNPASFLVGK